MRIRLCATVSLVSTAIDMSHTPLESKGEGSVCTQLHIQVFKSGKKYNDTGYGWLRVHIATTEIYHARKVIGVHGAD